jgi:hypothetical protein
MIVVRFDEISHDKFNQWNCSRVEMKSNDPLEFKFNQITCGITQIKIPKPPQTSN